MTVDATLLIKRGEATVESMRKALNEWLGSERFDTLVVFDIGTEDLAGLRALAETWPAGSSGRKVVDRLAAGTLLDDADMAWIVKAKDGSHDW